MGGAIHQPPRGIDERTREDYRRDLNLHFSLLQHVEHSRRVVPTTICNLAADDIQDWVRTEEKGEQDPEDPEKWLRRKADPKSIRNRHGLLFCIVQAAVEAEPQLRTKNCCKGTKLPRLDDHTEDEMTFLERDEFVRVATEIRDEGARNLAEWLVGTGMRWGEATALQVQDLNLRGATPTASIHRAWKRAEKGSPTSFFIGPPKTKRARRTAAWWRASRRRRSFPHSHGQAHPSKAMNHCTRWT